MGRRASGARTRRPTRTRATLTEAAAAAPADAVRAADAAARRSPGGRRRRRPSAARCCSPPPTCWRSAARDRRDDDRRGRRHVRLGHVQLHARRRHAAPAPSWPTRSAARSSPPPSPAWARRGRPPAAGVVVGIAPWNAPVILATRAVATPLAFGNTVVLKAPRSARAPTPPVQARSTTPACPAGVINLITNEPADAARGRRGADRPSGGRAVNFTGSTRVGRIVANNAAQHLKPALLELGGKAPFVVLADADLDEAAAAANFGAFMNYGQICMSTERIVVDRAVEDAFAESSSRAPRGLVVGDPRDNATMIGPVVNAAAAERVTELVEDAVAKGAEVVTGGDADGAAAPADGRSAASRPRCGSTARSRSGRSSRSSPSTASTRPSRRQRHRLRAVGRGLRARRGRHVGRSRAGSRAASATSTARPSTTSRRCPSAASRRRAGAASAATRALQEFTELRWRTVQDGGRHYPI